MYGGAAAVTVCDGASVMTGRGIIDALYRFVTCVRSLRTCSVRACMAVPEGRNCFISGSIGRGTDSGTPLPDLASQNNENVKFRDLFEFT